ncbi:MAG: general secretion pathway protein GspK [Rhodanobacteraceae bacterium]
MIRGVPRPADRTRQRDASRPLDRRERGTALLLVLWATMVLAALLIGVAAASRSHSEAALYGAERVRAELAAEAGIAHAIAGLRSPDAGGQWVPDGRPYAFTFDGAKVTVAVVDTTGQVDLNASPPDLLRSLFQAAGADPSRAANLAQAIAQFRGGTPRAVGIAGPGVRRVGAPSPGPFRAIDQLAVLPGMDSELFAKVANAVTVFSGRNFPDASYAGPLTVAALRGIGPSAANALVEARRGRPAQGGAGNGLALGAVTGGPLIAGYGGVVERVFSTAEMPDGARVTLDVTVRMTLTGARARPYKVLDWRTDSDWRTNSQGTP